MKNGDSTVKNERHNAAFMVGLIAGGLAGAGYMLLRAPRSGRETRRQIAAALRQKVQAAQEAATTVTDEAQRATEQMAERLDGVRSTVVAQGSGVKERIASVPSRLTLPLPGQHGAGTINGGEDATEPLAGLSPAEVAPADSVVLTPAEVEALGASAWPANAPQAGGDGSAIPIVMDPMVDEATGELLLPDPVDLTDLSTEPERQT